MAAYIANHREIQTLLIQLQQRELSHQSTKISQGVKLNLSTGTISIGSSIIRSDPSLTVSLPRLNGTYVEAQVPLQFSTANAGSREAAGAQGLQGASVSIGTEILGGSGKAAKLSLLKSERSLLEAQRGIQNQALTVEREFYTTIKDLYSSYASLLSSQSAVYTKELDLQTLRVQGYGAGSTRYRTTQLEVLSAQRTADRQQRNLQRELELFAQKCRLAAGTLSLENLSSAAALVAATGILDTLPLRPIEEYTAMESAQWSLATTQMELDADFPVTLTAEAGYTYQNQSVAAGSQPDTVDAALSLQALGGRLTSGIAIPIAGEEHGPTAQLSLSWSPNDMRTQSLQRQQNRLNLDLARLKIQDAEEDYKEAVENAELTWEDLLWSRQVALEEAELYRQLAEDTISLYNQGMTSETEYRQALVNRNRAEIQCEVADLELLLHCISTRQLFVQEVD